MIRQNLLHNLLFRKHVLGEDVPEPTPSISFSGTIWVKEETPLNIVTMAEKDWTRLLTEDFLTMTAVSDSGQQQFTPCRAERASPTTDWTRCWSACRQPGIPPDLASFMWLMSSWAHRPSSTRWTAPWTWTAWLLQELWCGEKTCPLPAALPTWPSTWGCP